MFASTFLIVNRTLIDLSKRRHGQLQPLRDFESSAMQLQRQLKETITVTSRIVTISVTAPLLCDVIFLMASYRDNLDNQRSAKIENKLQSSAIFNQGFGAGAGAARSRTIGSEPEPEPEPSKMPRLRLRVDSQIDYFCILSALSWCPSIRERAPASASRQVPIKAA